MQTLQLAREEFKAKGCLDVQKTILARDYGFFAAVLSKMIEITLIRGKCKFFFQNYLEICCKIYRLTFLPACVRSIVKSSSHNGLEILQKIAISR